MIQMGSSMSSILTARNDGGVYKRVFGALLGEVMLQRDCSADFVRSLEADKGLCAFARIPEREHQLLIDVAKNPESMLTIAHSQQGKIVGEATIAPAESWWQPAQQEVNVYEIGLEVSYYWRRQGIARQLLSFALDLDGLEDVIVIAMGLSWHWDTERTGISPFRYRELIAHVLAPYDFREYMTIEPNIASEPANILLVRIGHRVSTSDVNNFMSRLLVTENLL